VRAGDTPASVVGEGSSTVGIRRMLTNRATGSPATIGTIAIGPGVAFEFSLEEVAPADGVRHWGPIHEMYYVLRGELRITTEETIADCLGGDLYYFVPGARYRVENVGSGPVDAVYVATRDRAVVAPSVRPVAH